MDVVQDQSGLPFKIVDFATPEVWLHTFDASSLTRTRHIAHLPSPAYPPLSFPPPTAHPSTRRPQVFVGGLLGAMLVFAFSGLAIQAVGKCAQDVVTEVRAQFAERPGIMDGTQKPDYARCVAIVTKASLSEMKRPGLLALSLPVTVGFTFRCIGSLQHKPLLGPQVLAGFLMVATITGILLSLFLNNAGGAWDNAKKFIETGKYGGKGSEAHKAAVTGDTVGDPFKDTAGPSLHVLIKLLATVSLVLGPVFISTRTHLGD